MNELQLMILYPFIPALVTALIYLLRVRPRLNGYVIALAALIGVSVAAALLQRGTGYDGPHGFLLFYIWAIAMPILSAVNAIIWLIAAVRKKRCIAGAILLAALPLCCGFLLINFWAVILPLWYLLILWFAAKAEKI